jgi:hypothetical protein
MSRFKKAGMLLSLFCLVCTFTQQNSISKPTNKPSKPTQPSQLDHPDQQTASNLWSIGMFAGDSPLWLKPLGDNPVLTPDDVTDIKARYVADPFMVKAGSCWYMFFEVMNAENHRGEIAYATSPDKLHWSYKGVVLREQFHLSYPYVFRHRGRYYMIPESRQAHEIRLYKATLFPIKWRLEKVLIKGDYVDPSIVKYHGKWWIFAAAVPRKKALHLFYANRLLGPWTEHAKKPIVFGDKHITRPGGRVTVLNGKLVRFAQDDDPSYGLSVRAFQITRLTRRIYAEKELSPSPILKGSGVGWNGARMHTIDPHLLKDGSWVACVDGAPW